MKDVLSVLATTYNKMLRVILIFVVIYRSETKKTLRKLVIFLKIKGRLQYMYIP